MGLFRRTHAQPEPVDAAAMPEYAQGPDVGAQMAAEAEPSPRLASNGAGPADVEAASGGGGGRATTTAPAAEDDDKDGPLIAPPPPRLHRRSADSPLVGGFFRPLHPLGRHYGGDGDGGAHGHGHGHHNAATGDHHTRVSARAEDMLAQRLEDMKTGHLAHEPVEEDKAEGPARPWRAALRNLPVLLVMAGGLAVVLAAKSRLHVPEDLSTVHGVTSAEPYFMPLQSSKVDYLYVLATAAPWYGFLPPGAEGGGGHRRRRRRALLAAAVAAGNEGGDDAAARAAAAGVVDAAGDALYRAWEGVGWDRAAAERDDGWRLVARAAVSAGARAREIDVRGAGGGGGIRRGSGVLRRAIESGRLVGLEGEEENDEASSPHPARRRLAAAPSSSSSSSSSPPPPRLLLQLVEKVAAPPSKALPADISPSEIPTAVLGAPAYGFAPVGPAQYCQLKDGAASKCHFSFASATASAAAKPGSPLFLSVSLNQPGATAVDLHVRELGWLGRAKNWIALAILVVMLLAIASEKVHRMWCAVVASFCMLGLLLWIDMAPSLGVVMTWLDESTLGLLFGMMLIVGKTAQTGAFEVVCARTCRLANGSMALLTVLLLTVTALVSAFLDNVTTILLMGPITISLLKTMNADPRPLLVAQVLVSNLGGAATLVGDPPNIIIGTALSRYLGFVDFLVHMAPGVVIAFLVCVPLILWMGRASLIGRMPDHEKVLAAAADYRITDWSLFWKCTFVLGVVLLGFLLHPIHHLDPAWFAIMGATVLCISSDRLDVEELMHLVEWDMLIFFAALFCIVEGAIEVGLIDMIGGFLAGIIRSAPAEARRIVTIQILLWLSTIISALLDNVPCTLVMVPVIEYLAGSNLGLPLPLMAWALAFGACFGGNGTLIGASANIVGASILDKSGYEMGYLRWLRWGVPVTLVSVVVANAYLLLRYCLPGSTEYPPTPIL